MKKRRSQEQRDQKGAAAVEFALVVIPFITLVLGTIQFAWYFYAAQSASAAAREGARRVIVGDCWDPAVFTTYVRKQSPMITSASYTPGTLTGANIGDEVKVTVNASAGVINLFPLPAGGNVTREFTARLEDKSSGATPC